MSIKIINYKINNKKIILYMYNRHDFRLFMLIFKYKNKEKGDIMAKLGYMDVARYLYKKTNNMNNLKLQKMMFFAYIEYYEKYHEELFKDDFEAWVYGPVLPDLYYYFYKLLLSEDKIEKEIIDKNIQNVLNDIVEKYGNKDAFNLVELSHKNEIWINARQGLEEFEPSNIKLNIIQYYSNKDEKKQIKK